MLNRLVVALLAVFLFPAVAGAISLEITSGFLGGGFNLSPNAFLHIAGDNFALNNPNPPGVTYLPNPLTNTQTVQVGNISGPALTVNGIVYPSAQGTLTFFTPTEPAFSLLGFAGGPSGTFSLSAPFTMTGTLNVFSCPLCPTQTHLGSFDFVGAGLATATGREGAPSGITFRYDFAAPVPEPTSAALLMSGLAALGWSRLRRTRESI